MKKRIIGAFSKNAVHFESSLQHYTHYQQKINIVPNIIIGTLFAVVSKSQTLCIVLYKRFAKSCYLLLNCFKENRHPSLQARLGANCTEVWELFLTFGTWSGNESVCRVL